MNISKYDETNVVDNWFDKQVSLVNFDINPEVKYS